MALSYTEYVGDGSSKNFATPSYLDKSHIKVYVDGVEVSFTWLTSASVQLVTAPGSGSQIIVRRVTPISSKLAVYTNSFVVAVGLTVIAYLLVSEHVTYGHMVFSHAFVISCITLMAIAQLYIQVIIFLHLGEDQRPRWKSLAFGFMALMTTILVAGSLWIMKNLDYSMMPSHEIDQQIMEDEGIHH